MNSVYIARDNAIVPEDMEHFIERHPEREIDYAKLHIFYDVPLWNGNAWVCSRDAAEIKNYMYPEIGCGQCVEFLPITQQKLGQMKKLIEILDK